MLAFMTRCLQIRGPRVPIPRDPMSTAVANAQADSVVSPRTHVSASESPLSPPLVSPRRRATSTSGYPDFEDGDRYWQYKTAAPQARVPAPQQEIVSSWTQPLALSASEPIMYPRLDAPASSESAHLSRWSPRPTASAPRVLAHRYSDPQDVRGALKAHDSPPTAWQGERAQLAQAKLDMLPVSGGAMRRPRYLSHDAISSPYVATHTMRTTVSPHGDQLLNRALAHEYRQHHTEV